MINFLFLPTPSRYHHYKCHHVSYWTGCNYYDYYSTNYGQTVADSFVDLFRGLEGVTSISVSVVDRVVNGAATMGTDAVAGTLRFFSAVVDLGGDVLKGAGELASGAVEIGAGALNGVGELAGDAVKFGTEVVSAGADCCSSIDCACCGDLLQIFNK